MKQLIRKAAPKTNGDSLSKKERVMTMSHTISVNILQFLSGQP